MTDIGIPGIPGRPAPHESAGRVSPAGQFTPKIRAQIE